MSNGILDELNNFHRTESRDRPDPRVRPDVRQAAEQERVPLGGNRMRLTVDDIPGYHTHWLNDNGDRIERAMRGGYVFLPKAGTRVGTGSELGHSDIGSAMSTIVGTKEDGSPLRAYAMMIKQEYYDADQLVKHEGVKQTEQAIQAGSITAQDGDTSNRYIPEEGITIE